MNLATAEWQYLDLITERAKSVEWCFFDWCAHSYVYLVDADGTKKCMR